MAVRAVARPPSKRPPVKRRDGLTPAEYADRDRIARARPAPAAHDPDVYAEAAEFARSVGVEPSDVFDEIEERAAARVLVDNVSQLDAARLAFADVLERYGRRRSA